MAIDFDRIIYLIPQTQKVLNSGKRNTNSISCNDYLTPKYQIGLELENQISSIINNTPPTKMPIHLETQIPLDIHKIINLIPQIWRAQTRKIDKHIKIHELIHETPSTQMAYKMDTKTPFQIDLIIYHYSTIQIAPRVEV